MQTLHTQGEKLRELQAHYKEVHAQLAHAEQEAEILRSDLEVEKRHGSSKSDAAEFYHSIVQNIQMQIENASRPGSAASESQARADMIGALRQSIGTTLPLLNACMLDPHTSACIACEMH